MQALAGVQEALAEAAGDEQYQVQLALAEYGLMPLLGQLLDDGADNVTEQAAATLSRLVRHSTTTEAKLRHGKELGFCDRPEHVRFNPLQDDAEQASAIA